MITDAHQHVWDPRRLSYPWLSSVPDLDKPRLPEDSRTPGVDRVVFVQADAADGVIESEWVQGLARDWPELAAIVAFAPVETNALPRALDRLHELPLFRGVRRLLQDEPPGFITSRGVRQGLRVLAERAVPFDACVRHHQLGELRTALEDVPDVDVVLDHLGKPPVALGLDSREGEAWIDAIHALAELPSVVVKLSGLAPEADPERPLAEQSRPFLEVALRAFGAARCMVGSDWPVSGATPHGMTTAEWIELVGAQIDDPVERELVLNGTAARVYGLGR